MESVRKKLFKGAITQDEYRKEALSFTLSFLRENDFRFRRVLGCGGFGTVIEIEHPRYERIAAKIVLQEYVSDAEVDIWPKLRHQNILPVIKIEEVPSAYTSIFYMPVYPKSLGQIIESPSFADDVNAFEKSVFWLYDICSGMEYLHRQNMCHLDLKVGNIMISESQVAVINDFGSLTYTQRATENYVSPFIYRPPEALMKDGTKAIVDGFKYDVYTLGILAIELFTKERVWEPSECSDTDPKWADVMYGRIFNILKEKSFEKYVSNAFPLIKVDRKTVNNIRNLIVGCICLNPRNRLSVPEILKHRLFGGSENFEVRINDVWQKKASLKKINFLVSLFIGQGANLSFPSKSSHYPETNPPHLQISENDSSKLESDDHNFDQIIVEASDPQKPPSSDVSQAAIVESPKEKEKLCPKQKNTSRRNGFLRNILNRFFSVFKR